MKTHVVLLNKNKHEKNDIDNIYKRWWQHFNITFSCRIIISTVLFVSAAFHKQLLANNTWKHLDRFHILKRSVFTSFEEYNSSKPAFYFFISYASNANFRIYYRIPYLLDMCHYVRTRHMPTRSGHLLLYIKLCVCTRSSRSTEIGQHHHPCWEISSGARQRKASNVDCVILYGP